ncbi:MAG TPA: hypothetical protein EYH05_03220, partial [Anaerolineae bacterium]|nr:hypothetical protein [Anaerolineae bacterium]
MEISDFQVKETASKSSWLERLTIADAVFGLIVLAAGIIRFNNLDALPLSDGEAEAALAVWRFWQPGAAQVAVVSPAYFSLTAVLTQLLGFSDTVMRLVPALFGLGLVILPRFLQRRLGVIGVLAASLLLAVSPLLVITSRTVGGQSMALFAVLLTAVAFIRYGETAVPRWLYTLAAAVGLGLTSDTLFYSGLITLGLAWILFYKIIKRQRNQEEDKEENSAPSASLRFNPTTQEKRAAVLIGVVIFVLSGSLFLWYLPGLGDAARLLGDWLALFDAADGRTIVDPFFAFLRYEPILLIFGAAAVIWTVWRGRPLAAPLLYWLTGILLLMLLQQGVMANAALLTLPGYLLIGLLTQTVLGGTWTKYTGLLAFSLILSLAVIVVNFARYLRVVTFQPDDLQYIFVMMMAFFIALATIYLLSAYDVTAVSQGIFLAFLTVLLAAQWGQGWQLSHRYGNDPRERWVTSGTNEGMRLLSRAARDISYQL